MAPDPPDGSSRGWRQIQSGLAIDADLHLDGEILPGPALVLRIWADSGPGSAFTASVIERHDVDQRAERQAFIAPFPQCQVAAQRLVAP